MSKQSDLVKQLTIAVLAAFYLVVRFFFSARLDSFGAYASYVLEAVLVVVAIAIVGFGRRKSVGPAKWLGLGGVLALAAGFGAFKIAVMNGIPIPFNLEGAETLVFLLVVAPILEEALFRFFIWVPIAGLLNRTVAFVVTSLLFSYAHFHAYFFVPAEIHSFIYYQTAYTLLLAIGCGYWVWRYNSMVGAIATHFAFNLGFCLASLG